MQSITPLQLKFLNDTYNSPVPTVVFVYEDKEKDEPVVFARYYEANLALNGLVELGLMEDARPTKGQWLDTVEQVENRKFRMLQLTDLGRAFASTEASELVH